MNVLSVRTYHPQGLEYEVVQLIIDGRDLRECVETVELPFAAADGQAQLAGKYEGLRADGLLAPGRHLLGAPVPYLQGTGDDERVTLLACECGEPGCWPLVARVRLTGDVVEWSDFEQPHRPNWSYAALGPFRFARAQYETALGFRAD